MIGERQRRPRNVWAWIIGLAVSTILVAAGSVFAADHDSVKALPIVGGLWWGRLIGNTAIHAEKHDDEDHGLALAQAYRQHPAVVFVGDSLALNFRRDGRQSWYRDIAGLNALTLGVAGDRTQHLLYRIQSSEFTPLSPRVGVLIVGTNNVNRNTPEEIHEAIHKAVDGLLAIWPDATLVVVGVLPRERPKSPVLLHRIATLNQLLTQSLSGRPRIRVVTFEPEFMAAGGGINYPLFRGDGLHLSAAGYEILARRLAPMLAEILREHG